MTDPLFFIININMFGETINIVIQHCPQHFKSHTKLSTHQFFGCIRLTDYRTSEYESITDNMKLIRSNVTYNKYNNVASQVCIPSKKDLIDRYGSYLM